MCFSHFLLYGHIDNLELYAGLQAEDTVKNGICCGHTMMRGILGDAIALVRGDRFYTTDYTRESRPPCSRKPATNLISIVASVPSLRLTAPQTTT